MATRCCGGNKTKMVVKACGLVTGYQKEVFRWRSVAIIGGQPHAPTQDDYCNDWFILKNTWTQGISTVARLLWGFRFDPALDEHGNVIPVDIFNYT
jgi:hypothetical protein